MKYDVRKLCAKLGLQTSTARSGQDWGIDWNRKHPHPRQEDLVDFWCRDRLRNVIPPCSETPAGFDELAFLSRLFPLIRADNVVDLGCGYGRLALAFLPEIYLGLDINPDAIRKARNDKPNYKFDLIQFDTTYPKADLYMAYTVLLHIDDTSIIDVAQRLTNACRRLLIVEILNPSFRNVPSVVPNFVRARYDYERLFSAFELDFELRKPYARYPGSDLSYLLLTKKTPESKFENRT